MFSIGTIGIEECDSLNIPVRIFVREYEPWDDDETNEELEAFLASGVVAWRLTATNYLPRKHRLDEGTYNLIGTQEEIQQAIKKHIRPLYAGALRDVDDMISGKGNYCHFWSVAED